MVAPVVTLTTDFGVRDGYVGAVKGAILSRCPSARLVDITHNIPPQDILSGAVSTLVAASEYPAGTIHLVVIDPGVGGDRHGLIVKSGNLLYVGPDNGVLHFPLMSSDAEAYRIDPQLRSNRTGTTFDGRDWFGPVAGQLAAGQLPAELGTICEDVMELDLPDPVFEDYRWRGHILHIDTFGNLITDIPAPPQETRSTARTFLGDEPIGQIRSGYGDVGDHRVVATIGALGTVEIGVNGDNAARRFSARRGQDVEILFASPVKPPAMLLSGRQPESVKLESSKES